MNSNINYYDILGASIDSTHKQLLKAYRKKALLCHPDKNPGNLKAAEIFIELSEAFKILTDKDARAAFDKILRAKEAAKLRTKAFDDKRKKFKEDLDRRENAAQTEKENEQLHTEKFEELIKRLREEGSKLLKEQQELVEKQINEEKKSDVDKCITPKLKVKWKSSKTDHDNGGYNDINLKELFEKYGKLNTILISPKKKGLAIVEYLDGQEASMAFEFEKGYVDNPLIITWLEGLKPNTEEHKNEEPSTVTENDFENLVLMRMRQAEERKQLAKAILIEDNNIKTEKADVTS